MRRVASSASLLLVVPLLVATNGGPRFTLGVRVDNDEEAASLDPADECDSLRAAAEDASEGCGRGPNASDCVRLHAEVKTFASAEVSVGPDDARHLRVCTFAAMSRAYARSIYERLAGLSATGVIEAQASMRQHVCDDIRASAANVGVTISNVPFARSWWEEGLQRTTALTEASIIEEFADSNFCLFDWAWGPESSKEKKETLPHLWILGRLQMWQKLISVTDSTSGFRAEAMAVVTDVSEALQTLIPRGSNLPVGVLATSTDDDEDDEDLREAQNGGRLMEDGARQMREMDDLGGPSIAHQKPEQHSSPMLMHLSAQLHHFGEDGSVPKLLHLHDGMVAGDSNVGVALSQVRSAPLPHTHTHAMELLQHRPVVLLQLRRDNVTGAERVLRHAAASGLTVFVDNDSGKRVLHAAGVGISDEPRFSMVRYGREAASTAAPRRTRVLAGHSATAVVAAATEPTAFAEFSGTVEDARHRQVALTLLDRGQEVTKEREVEQTANDIFQARSHKGSQAQESALVFELAQIQER